MTIKYHKLPERKHFEILRESNGPLAQRMVDLIKNGKADFQYCYKSLFLMSLDNGYIVLILGESDEKAVEEFRNAVDYAMTLLTGSGPYFPLRSYELEVDVAAGGSRPSIREIPQPKTTPPLDPTYYKLALAAIVAFGDEAQRRVAADYPEEGYRNPNVIVDESLFTELRAMKAWLKGDAATAEKGVRAALTACKEEHARPEIAALLSLVVGDEAGFRQHLEERVKGYKKQYQRMSNMPEGFVYLFGLALCRLALERGIAVEDQPYLPVRLLPNYRGAHVG